MTKNIIYLIVFFAIILSSCSKDWLDKKSSLSLVVPATLEDMQALMDNTLALNSGKPTIAIAASNEFYMSETLFPSRTEDEKNAYTWSNTFPYQSESITGWKSLYESIFYCNVALEGLKKITPIENSDKELYNRVKGQALFHRAFSFYLLSQLWTPPYSETTNNETLGIPLRTESDVNLPTVRSNVKQTFDQIISDLMAAENLLSSEIRYVSSPSKVAAYALLARTYLITGDYNSSLRYANECLQIKSELLNFNNLSSVAARPILQPQLNPEVIYYSQCLNSAATNANSFINADLLSLYDQDDLRRVIFYRHNANGTANFKGSYTGAAALFDGISVNEVYLIRSECYARAGNTDKAMADLNTLLRNRFDSNVAYIDLTALDADDALHQVLLERRKELVFRSTRWSDLRRLSKDPRFAITLTRTVDGQTYTLEPGSYKYTFPIPDDIIQQTGIAQNPGWDN